MRFARLCLTSALCCAGLSWADAVHAVTFLEFVDPNPAPDNLFGNTVVALSTGNVVITSPWDDAGGVDAGAVYLFNGATGILISTLRGSTAGDQVGWGGVTALTNGNYVIRSQLWDNSATVDAGAVTWGSGISGVSGTVSAANSLVGSTANDRVGHTTSEIVFAGVTALTNGNYVVRSVAWDNGAMVNAGAVTWGNGASGVSGTVSAANSLVGSTANDEVGSSLTALTNGNYVIRSPLWDNGAMVNAGAVTWGNGTSGVSGTVSATNSLVGSTTNDQVGTFGVTVLSNANYVVSSSNWDSGAITDVGAVTWGSGSTGVSGVVSAANSLVGSTTSDKVGNNGVTALANGNYVVRSPDWDNGAIANAGAVTWVSGATGVSGTVSATNSLVGSTASDQVGFVTALTNGNYVVTSLSWDSGAVANAGAVTWGSGTTGVSGVVSAANSLVGSTTGDQVGGFGVTALTNGNYVIRSFSWDNGAIANVGAVTWASGTTGVSGTISATNSLVGSTVDDGVGFVTALTNGNYVVTSSSWDNGPVADAGAATWANGTTGVIGTVSAANSLVGSTAGDRVGSSGVRALTNGNYVVVSTIWNNGAGAVTGANGTTGMIGTVSAANSLVGSTVDDGVGSGGVTALTNGNYVVLSPGWDSGAVVDVGAATWGSGTTGVSGTVSAANSLVGSTEEDGLDLSVTALSNGNYLVMGQNWDDGASIDAGAVTWGSGATGVSGVVSAANSLVGSRFRDHIGSEGVTELSDGNYVVSSRCSNGGLFAAGAATWGSGTTGVIGVVSVGNSLVGTTVSSNLLPIVDDAVNGSFYAPFVTDGGGRVRVGPVDASPLIVSAVDIPADQGGWIRVTINRSSMDVAVASPSIATYGVWRHVPGTLPVHPAKARPSTAPDSPTATPEIEQQLRALLEEGLGAREVDGRLHVKVPGSPSAAVTATFPPGTWELVTSTPAAQQAQYVIAVPTLSNAAPNDFVVTAHTSVPAFWFISSSVSAQSVDNLAPSQPTGFTLAYTAGQTNLEWAASNELDLDSYRLYRGASADFTPSPGNRIAELTSTSYVDDGPVTSHYKLSAVDVNGNESDFAVVLPEQTSGEVVAFALHGAHPNPATGHALHVTFALPSAALARLELHDVAGRRVVAREVGTLGAGRHTVNLAEGRWVATGIYWVSLSQGNNQQRVRVAVLR